MKTKVWMAVLGAFWLCQKQATIKSSGMCVGRPMFFSKIYPLRKGPCIKNWHWHCEERKFFKPKLGCSKRVISGAILEKTVPDLNWKKSFLGLTSSLPKRDRRLLKIVVTVWLWPTQLTQKFLTLNSSLFKKNRITQLGVHSKYISKSHYNPLNYFTRSQKCPFLLNKVVVRKKGAVFFFLSRASLKWAGIPTIQL